MCRLFAQLSLTPSNAAFHLTQSRFSLLRQSCCNSRSLQEDGWGIAGLKPKGNWKVQKSKNAVFMEKAKFARAAQISSPIILAHIRRASNPRGLPKSILRRTVNCQPFAYRNLVFIHNGTLNIPDEVLKNLGSYRKLVQGQNDSEVLFALFVKHWNQSRRDRSNVEWKMTFNNMTRDILKVWRKMPASKRKHPFPYHGLNILASDGASLAAHCFYDRPGGRSLCGQGRPYFEMCYNIASQNLTIASEPLDRGKTWCRLKTGQVLAARMGNQKIQCSVL